jgi:hypothetical protein
MWSPLLSTPKTCLTPLLTEKNNNIQSDSF